MRERWSPEDRQRFRDGDRLRASAVPGKRPQGPSASEWGDWADWEATAITCPGSGRSTTPGGQCQVCGLSIGERFYTPTHRALPVPDEE